MWFWQKSQMNLLGLVLVQLLSIEPLFTNKYSISEKCFFNLLHTYMLYQRRFSATHIQFYHHGLMTQQQNNNNGPCSHTGGQDQNCMYSTGHIQVHFFFGFICHHYFYLNIIFVPQFTLVVLRCYTDIILLLHNSTGCLSYNVKIFNVQ